MCIITYTIVTYNKLTKLKVRVDNAWSQIDVQLKRRYDLIPNMVETVKGYASHEKETLSEVTRARASVGSAKTPEDVIAANNELTGALSRLLVVAERYPELKANANFMSLQNDLRDLESKIAISRQFYNDTAMNYNQKLQLFPSNLVAKAFKFKGVPYFEIEEAEKAVPQVKF
ncbi:MAG: LemA family protein [Firmicutes bacterium]|uniref:LemA family protein n=1 Tax=Candidatus Stercoripulliclostridium pullicola TaxID=2840953 RepID=A0A940DG26_9FIRM|nr:LemA family protein [Candidatus Stercoripulliclostridium pullicola]